MSAKNGTEELQLPSTTTTKEYGYENETPQLRMCKG